MFVISFSKGGPKIKIWSLDVGHYYRSNLNAQVLNLFLAEIFVIFREVFLAFLSRVEWCSGALST